MATITDPSPTDFATGAVPTGDQANAKVGLLGETDGRLDTSNMAATTKFRQHHVQHGTFTRNRSSGATANVDFLGDLLFPQFSKLSSLVVAPKLYTDAADNTYGIDELDYVPIPGLCEVMENPYTTASRVRITWRVSMYLGTDVNSLVDLTTDGEQRWNSFGNLKVHPVSEGGPRSAMCYVTSGVLRLFVNGVAHPTLLRRYRSGFSSAVPSTDYTKSEAQNYAGQTDFQVWEFSAVIDSAQVTAWEGLTSGKPSPLSKGSHTVSIRCFHTNRAVRFKTRYIDWTYSR